MTMYAVNDSAQSSDETFTVSTHAVVPIGHASSGSDAFCTSNASVKLGVVGNSVKLVTWEHLCKSCISPTFAVSGREHSISLQHWITCKVHKESESEEQPISIIIGRNPERCSCCAFCPTVSGRTGSIVLTCSYLTADSGNQEESEAGGAVQRRHDTHENAEVSEFVREDSSGGRAKDVGEGNGGVDQGRVLDAEPQTSARQVMIHCHKLIIIRGQ